MSNALFVIWVALIVCLAVFGTGLVVAVFKYISRNIVKSTGQLYSFSRTSFP